MPALGASRAPALLFSYNTPQRRAKQVFLILGQYIICRDICYMFPILLYYASCEGGRFGSTHCWALIGTLANQRHDERESPVSFSSFLLPALCSVSVLPLRLPCTACCLSSLSTRLLCCLHMPATCTEKCCSWTVHCGDCASARKQDKMFFSSVSTNTKCSERRLKAKMSRRARRWARAAAPALGHERRLPHWEVHPYHQWVYDMYVAGRGAGAGEVERGCGNGGQRRGRGRAP